MAFFRLDEEKLKTVKKIARFRNNGLCVIVLEGNTIVEYWREDGWLSEVDGAESEIPKLYVSVAAALKLAHKLNREKLLGDESTIRRWLSVTQVAALGVWLCDDIYIDEGGASNALVKYLLLEKRYPGSPRGKSR